MVAELGFMGLIGACSEKVDERWHVNLGITKLPAALEQEL